MMQETNMLFKVYFQIFKGILYLILHPPASLAQRNLWELYGKLRTAAMSRSHKFKDQNKLHVIE